MRLIDAQSLSFICKNIQKEYDESEYFWAGIAHAYNVVLASPTIDAVEVVRCKDCVHWFGECDDGQEHSCDMDALLRSANHFCAFGKRKESTQ